MKIVYQNGVIKTTKFYGILLTLKAIMDQILSVKSFIWSKNFTILTVCTRSSNIFFWNPTCKYVCDIQFDKNFHVLKQIGVVIQNVCYFLINLMLLLSIQIQMIVFEQLIILTHLIFVNIII
ncbi:unnamed protein product [Paramecium pentaurelia]|uniref:Transmembrane protein n=1 Tax=Paramecium pentaurelia TaxID=43138 RepID=A0A8S1UB18_9CILI|nr:unnamed protein product [Paramecium pentaurelia]